MCVTPPCHRWRPPAQNRHNISQSLTPPSSPGNGSPRVGYASNERKWSEFSKKFWFGRFWPLPAELRPKTCVVPKIRFRTHFFEWKLGNTSKIWNFEKSRKFRKKSKIGFCQKFSFRRRRLLAKNDFRYFAFSKISKNKNFYKRKTMVFLGARFLLFPFIKFFFSWKWQIL